LRVPGWKFNDTNWELEASGWKLQRKHNG